MLHNFALFLCFYLLLLAKCKCLFGADSFAVNETKTEIEIHVTYAEVQIALNYITNRPKRRRNQ